MATIDPVVTIVNHHTVKFFYETMLNGDDGAPIGPNHVGFSDRNISVAGVLGASGNVQVQGSDDGGATYSALNDAQGNVLDIASLKREQILEIPIHTRPEITNGDGSTDLDVTITCNRPRSGNDA